MAQVYKKLNIDVNKKSMDIITAVQNDAQSRFLDIVLLDGSIPIHLAEHEVRIYGKKHDGTEFYNNGEITDAAAGRCQFELTSQALAVAHDLEVQIIVFQDNREILSTQPFTVHVVKSLMSNSAIESSNEYGALVVLYQNLYEAYDLMTKMVQKIGEPKEQATALGLDTMFEVWDWMVAYLQENSTAGIVDTVNTISGRVGESNSTSDGTVFGKLNNITEIKEILQNTPQTKKFTNTVFGTFIGKTGLSVTGCGVVSFASSVDSNYPSKITVDGSPEMGVAIKSAFKTIYFNQSFHIYNAYDSGHTFQYIIQT